jgi:glycosyltransferase involved in cell wall biosynthesis
MSVSVLMTCFNEGPYITAAVDSVIAQTAGAMIDKILIMDDGSDQGTLDVLERLKLTDPRIEVRYCNRNGLPLNRNLAAQQCLSKYIAILDGDDLWAPKKLERQLQVMEADSMIGLIYTGYYLFSGLNPSEGLPCKVTNLYGHQDLTREYFLNDPPIVPSSSLMRRDRFEEAGMFDPGVRVFEDTEFFLRLSRICKFSAIDEPLIYKRMRGSSITGQRGVLMAHHAYIAFLAAASDPRLLPLVPKRLSQRARKLGNVYYYGDDVRAARQMYALAARLDPLSLLAWAGLLLSALGGRSVQRILRGLLKGRAAAFG